MRARSVNLGRAFFEQRFSGFYQRASGINDVVHDQRAASAHRADQVHYFADVHIHAALINDGQWRVQALGKEAGALHAAGIGRNNRQIR